MTDMTPNDWKDLGRMEAKIDTLLEHRTATDGKLDDLTRRVDALNHVRKRGTIAGAIGGGFGTSIVAAVIGGYQYAKSKGWVPLLLLALLSASIPAQMLERVGDPHATLATTTLPLRQVTRWADIKGSINPAITPNPGTGWTPGYSNRVLVSPDGRYLLAMWTNGWNAALYTTAGAFVRVLDFPGNGSEIKLGENNDIRWDKAAPSRLVYKRWNGKADCLFAQDAESGAETLVWASGGTIRAEAHGDHGGALRAVLTATDTNVVDVSQNKVIDDIAGIGVCDISPSGKWLMSQVTGKTSFYRIGNASILMTLPTLIVGQHDGWAYDGAGNEVYIYQDSKADWVSAFDPASGKETRIISASELAPGCDVNMHFGRMPSTRPGWLLMVTYAGQGWSSNQLMLLEIKPAAEKPRILRLGPNTCKYVNGAYFTEGLATISPDGNTVHFGSNVSGSLEIWSLDLRPAWALVDGPAVMPTPTPTPIKKRYRITLEATVEEIL
jgi:hypothetical protein